MISAGETLDGMLQAMIDVILDQGAFGLAHGFFHGVKLLGDIHTGTTLFNHGENAAQVPLCSLQSFTDCGMTLMVVAMFVLAHYSVLRLISEPESYPPRGDAVKSINP